MGARDALSDAATAPAAGGDARQFPLSGRDFDRVRRIIFDLAGIDLNASKQNMVYACRGGCWRAGSARSPATWTGWKAIRSSLRRSARSSSTRSPPT
jgi:hypothetical protein